MKLVNLHEDEPTVRAFVKETMAIEHATKPKLELRRSRAFLKETFR